jgi:hypothetical protein
LYVTRGVIDHRSTERYRIQLPALVRPVREGEADNAIELVTSNVCSGGAYFHTDTPLPLGTEVDIEIVLPLDKLKQLKGKRAHVRVSGAVIRASGNGMAVCFQDDYVISPSS